MWIIIIAVIIGTLLCAQVIARLNIYYCRRKLRKMRREHLALLREAYLVEQEKES